ncbi:MAG: Pectate lyase superfamily protein, partial [Abditibacteriota bacterium]|nr:Pectate lyase superfamily protein [Abditibacteriota bacterium]
MAETQNWYDFITGVIRTTMPEFDVKKFGAVGDGVADDWAAFDAAIKAASPNADGGATGVIANPFGGKVKVPVGRYYLSKPLDIVREIVLEGVSGAGREAPGSVLLFDANKVGIFVHRYNTAPLEDPLVPGGKFRQGRGDFSVIRDVSLQAKERAAGTARVATAHAIHMHARALIENCFIKNFAGNGIHMDTDETV